MRVLLTGLIQYDASTYALQQIDAVGRQEGRVLELLGQNLLLQRVAALALEGRFAREHVVEQDAERPEIGGAAVGLALDHLGRHVLYRRGWSELRSAR